MSQFLPEPLTREEFAALKQIGDARKHGTIPAKIRERLILIGYAKEVLGGLIVTDEGMLRIVMGKWLGFDGVRAVEIESKEWGRRLS